MKNLREFFEIISDYPVQAVVVALVIMQIIGAIFQRD